MHSGFGYQQPPHGYAGQPQYQTVPAQGPPQGPPADTGIWMFEVKAGVWQPVAVQDNKTMEDVYTKNPRGTAIVLLYGGNRDPVEYELDFQTMQRRNTNTGSTRTMKRVTPQELSQFPPNSILPPPQQAAPEILSPQWILVEEGQQPLGLDPNDTAACEDAYQKRATQVVLGGTPHTVDFRTWVIVNLGSGQSKHMMRIFPKELPPVLPGQQGTLWYFQDEGKNWVPFQQEDSDVVEKQFHQGDGVVSLRDILYTLDFKKWVRVNNQSGSCRAIRRLVDGNPNPAV